MRYRDASHVDVRGFYSRLPQVGKIYRILGYAAVAAMLLAVTRGDRQLIVIMLSAVILIWLAAWFQVVGTLWRSSLVSALVIAGIYLTIARFPPVGATVQAEESR
jgi:hypothetical protein